MTKTIKLNEWVPALAKELNGKKYSPNHDLMLHLKAQKVARRLNITWGVEMPITDVAKLQEALRTK